MAVWHDIVAFAAGSVSALPHAGVLVHTNSYCMDNAVFMRMTLSPTLKFQILFKTTLHQTKPMNTRVQNPLDKKISKACLMFCETHDRG